MTTVFVRKQEHLLIARKVADQFELRDPQFSGATIAIELSEQGLYVDGGDEYSGVRLFYAVLSAIEASEGNIIEAARAADREVIS